jgi:arsenate reductase
MDVTIWHNPNCGTSRKVLAALRKAGHEPTIVEYLKAPPDAATLRATLKAAGITAQDLLRRKGTPWQELGLDRPGVTEAEIIAAMQTHPVLIERPVVITAKGAALCRPAEKLAALL